MKKIILFFFILVLILTFSNFVCASEVISFQFPFSVNDGASEFQHSMISYSLGTLKAGNYRYTLSGTYNGGFTLTGVCSLVPCIYLDLPALQATIIRFEPDLDLLFPGYFYFIDTFYTEGVSGGTIGVMDLGTGVIFYDVTLELEIINNPSFKDSVSSGLNTVISWIQSLTSALISGSLSPILLILAVGIVVSALFLGAKYIYMICWGC